MSDPAALTERQIRLVFVALIAGTSLSAIDGTAVNTALSSIIADFDGLKSYTWVGIAYVLTSTACTPCSPSCPTCTDGARCSRRRSPSS